MSIAYLGPPGSFTEAALHGLYIPHHNAVPYPTVRQALDAVRRAETTAAVIPWENSVEGAVTESVDALVAGRNLSIVGETLLRVEFALAVPPAGTLGSIRQVLTHPIAHAQCRTWLDDHLPRADVVTTSSTAHAAREVGTTGAPGLAAIAAPNTLERYGLKIVACDIGDRQDAVTRFVKVAPPTVGSLPTGADRTSMVVPLADKMQQLHAVLEEFTRACVPLTAVLSRPGGSRLGTYFFLLECEGHVDDPEVGLVVATLARRHAVHVLGSYPRADLSRLALST
ncbi:prephenate dehydratase [Streptomyces sp. Qhu-G9]|uniref:prephenate dehydratase n=1 Tax=Streptomyces sp. Qhu-G9 TaxID=3452799 RepID=UPI0022ABE470|nr:prephenate dehydratase [Streptomyces aurantiacus]WAU82278.1 prephenate dehydratase [Streptomyces aurantiacus]